MKCRHFLLLIPIFIFWNFNLSFAQCGNRYKEALFPQVKKTTETYSDTFKLKVDIFEPQGDTLSKRPLVILAFGGSFITGGRALDPTIVQLCNYLAKRGYVTASIDYRLAENPVLMLDSAYSISTVIKAVSDGKAAIRYFVKDAATVNKYKIDTNYIFVGGNSAGAVLYMHTGYLNKLSEADSGLQQVFQSIGGLEGNSGNEGYSYKLSGVINLAGGLHSTDYISSDDPSSFNMQGSDDAIVPFNCDKAMNKSFITLCGFGSLEPVYIAKGVDYFGKVFKGKGHVPWADDTLIFDTLKTNLVTYLYNKVCTQNQGIYSSDDNLDLKIFPNPAGKQLNISSTYPVQTISIYNQLGQSVLSVPTNGKNVISINTGSLANGIYFLKVYGKDFLQHKKLVIKK